MIPFWLNHFDAAELDLTDSDIRELEHCEAEIESGVRQFIRVGLALATVRDHRLYRAQFATFEQYCAERWGLERRRCYQLMDAAPVGAEMLAAGVHVNEAQAMQLARVPAEKRIEIMERVKAAGKVTAAAIQECATAAETRGCEKNFTKLGCAISRDIARLVESISELPDERIESIEENLRFAFEAVEERFITLHPERAAILEKPLRRLLALIEGLKTI